jgi:N-acetylneuraminate synthase|tara:strand:- start:218 stop:1054 length:837 start_codon:yes stop_codon:yes gene_type:complete
MKTFIISEIGINHNGSLDIVKKLIDNSIEVGCDAVKFQKRTVDRVYTQEFLESSRESSWGDTQRAQKDGLEFGKEEYDEIDRYCKEKEIEWFASAWDIESQLFLRQYNLKYNKIASPMLTHKRLLETVAEEGKYTFISTGMSTMEQIEKAVKIFRDFKCPFELMHCNSSYPTEDFNANLSCIKTLRERFDCNVGYSGHEKGMQITLAAVALGVTSVERHITLDRFMYGSDQFASVNPMDLIKICKIIRIIEKSMGSGIKTLREEEKKCLSSLRRVDTL